MQVALRRPVPAVAVFVVAIFVVLSACSTVQLVSYYDEPTDRALTALQQSTDEFITRLIAAAPSADNAFDEHKQFYEDADQQKVAAAAVLTFAEGMTAVAVQAALNAALKVVKDVVNGKAGFKLL